MNDLYQKAPLSDTSQQEKDEGASHQRAVPKFNMPILIPYFMYTPCYRTTHSDVMCTTNTPQRLDWNKKTTVGQSNKASACRLPYEEIVEHAYFTNMRNNETVNEKKQLGMSRNRRNKELHAEHRAFMERLKSEREQRVNIEAVAAVKIQRIMRGFAVRERMDPGKYEFMRKSVTYTADDIRRQLIAAAKKSGLNPMPGLTLH